MIEQLMQVALTLTAEDGLTFSPGVSFYSQKSGSYAFVSG